MNKTAIYALLGILVISISIGNVVIHFTNKSSSKVLAASTEDPAEKEIEFWKELIQEYPTYRDAYLELAKLYKEKGLDLAAKQALDKAIEIDPFVKTEELF